MKKRLALHERLLGEIKQVEKYDTALENLDDELRLTQRKQTAMNRKNEEDGEAMNNFLRVKKRKLSDDEAREEKPGRGRPARSSAPPAVRSSAPVRSKTSARSDSSDEQMEDSVTEQFRETSLA